MIHYYYYYYLVRLGIAESLLLHAQVTHLGHELMWADEKARAEQEGEDVGPLWRRKKTCLIEEEQKGNEALL